MTETLMGAPHTPTWHSTVSTWMREVEAGDDVREQAIRVRRGIDTRRGSFASHASSPPSTGTVCARLTISASRRRRRRPASGSASPAAACPRVLLTTGASQILISATPLLTVSPSSSEWRTA
jgi:hypothetical protein